jgi:hypothetical protein
MTIAKFSLIAIVCILIASPWIPAEIEDTLILCSGLSNLVAIIDISRLPQLSQEGQPHRWVRVALALELFLLAWIIGADFGHIVVNDDWRIVISCVMVLFTIFYVSFVERPNSVKIGLLIFGLILSAALHTNAEAVGKLSYGMPKFVAERSHAWVHLLFIPVLYMVTDSLIRNHVPIAKRALILDVEILAVGVACAVAGLRADNPRFEAGAAAAVLLLGNWVYVSYIHKAISPPDNPELTPEPDRLEGTAVAKATT